MSLQSGAIENEIASSNTRIGLRSLKRTPTAGGAQDASGLRLGSLLRSDVRPSLAGLNRDASRLSMTTVEQTGMKTGTPQLLFVAEGLHGVYAEGAAGGDEAGEQRYGE